MSSLAASKSDNFYFPPDWHPEYGGISKFQGSNGANQYQKYGIVRYELPFDAWCLQCKRHMSKGLRFNAKKDHTGDYYSTKIYSFTTKCPSCDQQFIIRTNPKERTYDFVEGLRKHEQDYTPDATDGVITILEEEEKLKIANDPMYKLQHVNEDEYKARTTYEQLTELQKLNQNIVKNDYDINSILRKKNRALKHKEIKQKEDGKKAGLSFPLLDYPSTDEKKKDEIMHFQLQKKLKIDHQVTEEILRGDVIASDRSKILSQSIFSSSSKDLPSLLPSSSSSSKRQKKEPSNLRTTSSIKDNHSSSRSSDNPLIAAETNNKQPTKKRKLIDLQQLMK